MFKNAKKGIRDMKDMAAAAPGLMDQARQMQANAADIQAGSAHQTAPAPSIAGRAPASSLQIGPDFEPIAGVSLELYAEISKGLAAFGYDQSKAVDIAASKGVDSHAWQVALDGWNARITGNREVAQHFNRLYMGR